MKKLMFAVAAVAAGVAMADVTSANIVGYAQNSELDLDYGAVMQTPQFVNVGNESGLKLSSIIPVADESVDLSWNIEIQWLNAGGETIPEKDFIWVDGKWSDWDGNPVKADEILVDFGSGLWVFNSTACSVRLQTAGEVCEKDALVGLDLDYGAVAVGNPFPVSITLNDMFPVSEIKGIDLDWNIEIQWLNAGGETISEKDYVWIGGKWCTWEETPVDSDKIAILPGEAVWAFNSTGEAVSMRVVAPEF